MTAAARPSRDGGAAARGKLAAALALADRGWPLCPVKPDKSPRTLHGLKDATTNRSAVRNWLAMWPDSGIAIRTGTTSGLVVLDIDPAHGGDDTLHQLEREHGALPETVECATGGGGRHLYFKHPGGTVRNSTGKLGRGLDVRGDGGYVVAPPSPHPSGRRYEWDCPPDETPLSDMPAWILAGIREESSPPCGRVPAQTWVGMIRDGLPEGERNTGLTRLVGHLLARDVDPRVVLEIAHLVNDRSRPPLSAREVDRLADSIAGREVRRRKGSR